MLAIEIGNPTRVAVADIRVTIAYADAQGTTRRVGRTFSGPLAAGATRQLTTGVGPIAPGQNYAVSITSARIVQQ
jgi:hypothetical protein